MALDSSLAVVVLRRIFGLRVGERRQLNYCQLLAMYYLCTYFCYYNTDEVFIKMKKLLVLASFAVLLSSCGEYYKVQKSQDIAERYSFAKKSYNEGRYTRVVTLMEDIIPSLSGTSEGPQSTFLMADSYLQLKRETEAAQYFKTYYTSYPKGEQIEEARYKAGYCNFLASPEPRLEQSATLNAIQDLQNYLDYYPKGQYRKEVERMLFTLQDKLAEKELLSAKLYYNLGLYLGNNYQSCVITAQNAIKDYPYSKHKEELMFLVLKAKAEEASLSVTEKQQERVREALDHYYNYLNVYPEGRFAKEANRLHEKMNKILIKE